MKTKLFTITLFLLTATTVIAYPLVKSNTSSPTSPPIAIIPYNDQPKIEVVFVLDTTGSMGALIEAAKEKIWSIASTMASAQTAPEIKMGLVAYRDRGDDYVTKVIDLSSDLDSIYATLMDFKANGGGDGPESVNQALDEAVNKVSWSQDQDTYKVVFMVGDAPPHMDYQDDVKYPVTAKIAKQKGILINTIQCGTDNNTKHQWLQIAQLGGGDYFQVEQTGSAVAVATPYDKKLAELSKQIEETKLYFGNKAEKAEQRIKTAAKNKLHAMSSAPALARRAEFNASASGKENMYGRNELIESIESGEVDLVALEKEELPVAMQSMTVEEQTQLLENKAQKRKQLEAEIALASRDRKDFLKKKAKEDGGYKDSLDDKIYSAVRKQAADKGLVYEADAPAY
ncbi:MAG: VWA domain-containing protein [Gammaproteobacteria bacterium]